MIYSAFDDLTPEIIRSLSDEELTNIINTLQIKAIDISIVNDLIRDRNDFRMCYNMLVKQLQDLGVEPVIDYMGIPGKKSTKINSITLKKKGKKKNV